MGSAGELQRWLDNMPAQSTPPWLLVVCDDALALTMLESAADNIDPERVIGMTRAQSIDMELAREAFKLPRSIIKPVLRSALVSRLGVLRRGVSAQPVTVAARPVKPGEAPPSVRVLVVEDDPLNQLIVCRLLSHVGYESTAVNDGAQALALFSTQTFDLVLMDWQMPDMDGLEVTRRMRAGECGPAGKTVPIMALTANAFAEDRATCLAAGMNDFLTKPVLASKLLAMVRQWTLDPSEYQRDAPSSDFLPSYPSTAAPAPASPLSLSVERPPVYDPSVLAALPMVADGSAPHYAQELMDMFIGSVPATLSQIEKATADPDPKQLQRAVHTLKSTCASVGAMEMAALAEAHESRLRQGLPPVEELPLLLADAFKRLQQATSQFHRLPSEEGSSA